MRCSQKFLLLFYFKVFKEAMAFELQHARTLSLEWILMQYFITSLVTVIKKGALNSSLMMLKIKIEFPEIFFFEVLAMFSGFRTPVRQREIEARKWGHTDTARLIACAPTWERGRGRQLPRSGITDGERSTSVYRYTRARAPTLSLPLSLIVLLVEPWVKTKRHEGLVTERRWRREVDEHI